MVYNFKDYLDKINEGLLKTYDVDFVIEKSLQRLSVLNVKYDIKKSSNNSIKLTLYDFNKIYIEELFNLLNANFINLFGWFPSYMYMTNLSGQNNQMNYNQNYLFKTYEYLNEISIIYESKFDIVKILPEKLYHISIQDYKRKILRNGLIPKSKSKISSHDERIYVCDSLENCEDLIPKMKFYFFNKNSKINTKWVIFEINTENLDVKLYNDPNYINKGFYLLGNIPANNIKIIKEENARN